MKRYWFILALASATGLQAQDIYEMESLNTGDLNGTARFVGMGGAMSALGADLSVMSTNPAGIGLYRRSDVAVTGGFSHLMGKDETLGHHPTKASFDNIGFVYSANFGNSGTLRFLNMGFNYHRHRNNNMLFSASGALGGLSQSLQMLDLSYDYASDGWLDLSKEDDRYLTSSLPGLGYDVGMLLPQTDAEGHVTGYTPVSGNNYRYQRAQWGGINQYDFNLSANFSDRVYVGVTVGLYDVGLHTSMDYAETFDNNQGQYLHQMDKSIEGNGVDFKGGIIVRPIETSSLRIGLAFSTPVFYDLTSKSTVYMESNIDQAVRNPAPYDQEPIGYSINTPWRMNVSLGGTVGRYVAIGAEYEYANYSRSRVKYGSDYYDDYWWGTRSATDEALREQAEANFEKVHTVRVGAEFQLPAGFQLRVGYNHVTAPMKKNAALDLLINSESMIYSVNTDYLNPGATNRYTAGLGYRGKHVYFDAAYQYQKQNGEFSPFYVPESGTGVNRMQAQSVKLDRQSFKFTLGYKF